MNWIHFNLPYVWTYYVWIMYMSLCRARKADITSMYIYRLMLKISFSCAKWWQLGSGQYSDRLCALLTLSFFAHCAILCLLKLLTLRPNGIQNYRKIYIFGSHEQKWVAHYFIRWPLHNRFVTQVDPKWK